MAEKAPLVSGAPAQQYVNVDELFAQDETSEPSALSWSGLKFDVKDRAILKGIDGETRPSELCAIMGPSGAGKSTLLNILAGRIASGGGKTLLGNVALNGQPIDPVKFRRQIAYVMQEDALFATQTPREALTFSAGLRLPKSMSTSERESLVNRLLNSLGLDKCADTYIGSIMIPGISGGEKKRTAIGVELISKPNILFLDEPTSGLDSYAAFVVVEILQKLAKQGRTIISTIHQPSSEVFSLFDSVYLLAQGGTVFSGGIAPMKEHFASQGFPCPENYNPADHVMFVMQTQSHESLHEHWQKEGMAVGGKLTRRSSSNVGSHKYVGQLRNKEGAGIAAQMKYLSLREGRNVVRDKAALGARFGMTIFLNLIVGFVFMGSGKEWGDKGNPASIQTAIQNHFGAVAQVAIGGMFGLSQPLLLSFPIERPVFLREYANGTYTSIPYFISKLLVEIPLSILQSAVLFLVTYWLVGLQGNFFYLTLTTALLGLVASSTALIVGAASPNVNTAVQLTPLLFVPQIMFSGFFIRTSAIPSFLRWAQYLCSLKYAINLLAILDFGNPPSDRPELHDVIYGTDGFYDSNDIVPDHKWIYVGIMMGAFVGFRVLALLVLASKGRNLAS